MILLINTIIHKTIKTKPTDVTKDSYAEYNENFNKKDPRFKAGDYVRISKYKNIFAKGYTPNWLVKLYVKWKGYDNRFNSWVDKKDLICV